MTKLAQAKVDKLGEVERVYRILRDWLITAKLPPGEFLSEADLAERCGTSRTPVREACTRLMQDHWLTRIRRKGFDLYDYRKLLECYAAEKLAQTASHEQWKELASILAPEKDPSATLEQILIANQTFHRRLVELAGNQRVIGQLNLTLSYVTRLDTLCTQTVPGWIGHGEILRAIERREPAEARNAMQVHVDASRDKMVKLFSA